MKRFRMSFPSVCMILLTGLFCLTGPAFALEEDSEIPEAAAENVEWTNDAALELTDNAAAEWTDDTAFEADDAAFEWAEEEEEWEAAGEEEWFDDAFIEEDGLAIEEETGSVLEEGNVAPADEAEETAVEETDDKMDPPNGNCGANIQWTLDTVNGILTLSGTGATYSSYSSSNHPGWYNYAGGIYRVVVGEGITEITDCVFYSMPVLLDVKLPSTLERIGDYAFYYCSVLQSVTIPSKVTELGRYAFKNCKNLLNVSLPNSLTTIQREAFASCISLGSVSLPDEITYLGYNVFEGDTSLKSVKLPGKLTELFDSVFKDCTSLKSVTFPAGLVKIGNQTFMNCTSLTSVTLPASLKETGSAFLYCTGLKEAVLGGSLDTLGANAFGGCTSLEKVTINGDVNSMGMNTFRNCSSLKEIRCLGNNFAFGSDPFYGLSASEISKIQLAGFKGTAVETSAGTYGLTFKALYRMTDASVTGLSDLVYTGKALTPVPVVKVNNTVLKNGTDYVLSYKNNTAVGTAAVTVTGKDIYVGSTSANFKIISNNVSSASVSGLSDMTYTGKTISAAPVVKMNNTVLKNGTDYSLSYKNNKKIGSASVTITGKGRFTGSITKSFNIVPKGTSLSRLTGGKKRITVRWKKQKKSKVSGYQIQVSLQSDFSGARIVKVKGAKKTTKAIKKLKAKSNYYVRVRTYKRVGKTDYCSAWSSPKSVRTR